MTFEQACLIRERAAKTFIIREHVDNEFNLPDNYLFHLYSDEHRYDLNSADLSALIDAVLPWVSAKALEDQLKKLSGDNEVAE